MWPTSAVELYIPQVFEALRDEFTTDQFLICCLDNVASYIFHLHLHWIITESWAQIWHVVYRNENDVRKFNLDNGHWTSEI